MDYGRIFVTTGGFPVAIANLSGAGFLALDAAGRLVASSYDDGFLRLYNTNGTLISGNFAAVTNGSPLARGPGGWWGTDIYAVASNGDLVRVGQQGNATNRVGSGFGNLMDIAFGPDGALCASDFDNDRVWRIAPSVPGQVLFQDNFAGTLNPAWAIVRQDASYYSLLSTGLVRRCNSGDLYQGNNNAKNVFLITNPAMNDFTATLRLRWLTPPAQAYAQMDLLAYDDDDNQVRPQYVATDTSVGLGNAIEVAGSYIGSVVTAENLGANWFWMQMQKDCVEKRAEFGS